MAGNAHSAGPASERPQFPPQPGGDPRAAVFAEMRQVLERLGSVPLIRDDSVARLRFEELGRAEDMDAFHAALARLDQRVSALLAESRRKGEPSTRARPARTLLKL